MPIMAVFSAITYLRSSWISLTRCRGSIRMSLRNSMRSKWSYGTPISDLHSSTRLNSFPRWCDLNHFREIAQFREFTDGRKYEDLSKVSHTQQFGGHWAACTLCSPGMQVIIFAVHNVLMDLVDESEAARAYQLLRLMRRYLELDMFSSLRNHSDATLELGRRALLDWEKELMVSYLVIIAFHRF